MSTKKTNLTHFIGDCNSDSYLSIIFDCTKTMEDDLSSHPDSGRKVAEYTSEIKEVGVVVFGEETCLYKNPKQLLSPKVFDKIQAEIDEEAETIFNS